MSMPAPPGGPGRQVQCKSCLAIARVPDGADPHSMTWCGCCAEDHHHGEGAAACGPEAHGGEPCWNPPSVPRPDGCGVCRPVMHFVVAGSY